MITYRNLWVVHFVLDFRQHFLDFFIALDWKFFLGLLIPWVRYFCWFVDIVGILGILRVLGRRLWFISAMLIPQAFVCRRQILLWVDIQNVGWKINAGIQAITYASNRCQVLIDAVESAFVWHVQTFLFLKKVPSTLLGNCVMLAPILPHL